jgi:hypothetical protein
VKLKNSFLDICGALNYSYGKKLIEIFIEQNDKIMDAMYNDDMDDLASKLKFKKSLLPG